MQIQAPRSPVRLYGEESFGYLLSPGLVICFYTERIWNMQHAKGLSVMKIGVWELLVVFVVALVVIGPDKLPEYAKKLGEALRQFRKYSSEAAKEIRESVVEPLQEAQKPIREAMEPINDLEKSVRGEMNGLKKSINEIGKVTPAKEKEAAPADEAKPEDTAAVTEPAEPKDAAAVPEAEEPDTT